MHRAHAQCTCDPALPGHKTKQQHSTLVLFVRAWRRHGTNFSRICTANSGYTSRRREGQTWPRRRLDTTRSNSVYFKPSLNCAPERPDCFNCSAVAEPIPVASRRPTCPTRYGFTLSRAISVDMDLVSLQFKNVQFWIPETVVSRCVFPALFWNCYFPLM